MGCQELDTPLAFTESWNIANNTFDTAGLPSAETMTASASYKVSDTIKLTAQYSTLTDAMMTLATTLAGEDNYTMDMNEFTAILDTSVYGFDISLAYIYSDFTTNSADKDINDAGTYDNNILQAYITYKF